MRRSFSTIPDSRNRSAAFFSAAAVSSSLLAARICVASYSGATTRKADARTGPTTASPGFGGRLDHFERRDERSIDQRACTSRETVRPSLVETLNVEALSGRRRSEVETIET